MSLTKLTVDSRQQKKAIQQFSKQLPDAKTCLLSTIQQKITVGDHEIVLQAQKTKGTSGMTWRISLN